MGEGFAFDLTRPPFLRSGRSIFDALADTSAPSNEQIAEKLGITISTVKHALEAAAKLLPKDTNTDRPRKSRERIAEVYRRARAVEGKERLERTREARKATEWTSGTKILRRDTTLACRLQDHPTRTWNDAPVASFRLWSPTPRSRQSLEPVRVETLAGDVVPTPQEWVPFLLLRELVPSEWWAAHHVRGPLWSRVKRLVVAEFLRQVSDKELPCVVGIIYPNGTFHLRSSDYEHYLTAEHERFKTLENVLSVNRFLRDPALAAMTKERLRVHARTKLLKDPAITETIPQPIDHDGFRHPGLFAEPIYRVLRGLLELNGLVQPGNH